MNIGDDGDVLTPVIAGPWRKRRTFQKGHWVAKKITQKKRKKQRDSETERQRDRETEPEPGTGTETDT